MSPSAIAVLASALALLAACQRPNPNTAASSGPPASAPAPGGPVSDADAAPCWNIGLGDAARVVACTAIIQSGSSVQQRATALNNLGVIFAGEGDKHRAIADYDAAIRLNSTYPAAFYNRAHAKRDKGDTPGADADAAQAVRLDPHLAGH